MELLHAIVMGIVQGLTEFLPISSTAHLRIVPALMGWGDPGAAFSAVIQWGTLLAVLAYFRDDIIRICRAVLSETLRGQFCASIDSRLGWMIAFCTIPIVVFGLLFKNEIETKLRNLYVISGALIGLAIVLMLAEYLMKRRVEAGLRQKQLEDIGWSDAWVMGFFQAVSLVPGSSRSGVTITGGLFQGLSREAAARFSFLLSLPAIFAAGVLELYQHRRALLDSTSDAMNLVAATLAAFIVGYLCIAFLLHYLRHHSTWLFIVYRIALGCLLLALLYSGRLKAQDSGGVDREVARQAAPVAASAQ